MKPVFKFLFAVAMLLLFLFIAHEVIREKEVMFDNGINRWMDSFSNPQVTSIMSVITFFGSVYFLVPAYLLLAIWLWIRISRTAGLYFFCISAIGTVVMVAAKYLFHRNRPEIPLVHAVGGFSFPSGHVTSSIIFFGWLGYILIARLRIRGWLRWFIILLAILICGAIGFSRVYLEVHYATDVLAGFCLGILYFMISMYFRGRFIQKGLVGR